VVSDYLTVDSTGFNFSAQTEAREILNSYVGAVQNLEYKGPYIEHAYNEHKFLTQEMIDGKKHRPDSIIAAALSHRAKTSGVPEFLMGRA
uniref:hypothetical protein n=1 Tax=uncultured Arthrobacter sp. TaxID=114050 RepID=UPI0025D659E0